MVCYKKRIGEGSMKILRTIAWVCFLLIGYVMAVVGANFKDFLLVTCGIVFLNVGFSIYIMDLHLSEHHEKKEV